MMPTLPTTPDGRPAGPELTITVDNVNDHPLGEWAKAAGAIPVLALYVVDAAVPAGRSPLEVPDFARISADFVHRALVAGHNLPLGPASPRILAHDDPDLPGLLDAIDVAQADPNASGHLDTDLARLELATLANGTLVLFGIIVLPGQLDTTDLETVQIVAIRRPGTPGAPA